MTECEKQLTICIEKHIAALDRESRHAAAAAVLDEGVVYTTDAIESMLRSHKKPKVGHLLERIRSIYTVLRRAHDSAATSQQQPVEDEVPLVRLGPGGDYIIDIMEDDV
ncbi:MAG: hypothetical protein QF471_05355 [Phycisphaerales bacterium]|jgi:hypothetical protein|nr:hypothetical protein [Phycisphaerales bacterium]